MRTVFYNCACTPEKQLSNNTYGSTVPNRRQCCDQYYRWRVSSTFNSIIASGLGFIPQTLLFSRLGGGSRYINAVEKPIHIAGLVISVLLILSMLRFTHKDHGQ